MGTDEKDEPSSSTDPMESIIPVSKHSMGSIPLTLLIKEFAASILQYLDLPSVVQLSGTNKETRLYLYNVRQQKYRYPGIQLALFLQPLILLQRIDISHVRTLDLRGLDMLLTRSAERLRELGQEYLDSSCPIDGITLVKKTLSVILRTGPEQVKKNDKGSTFLTATAAISSIEDLLADRNTLLERLFKFPDMTQFYGKFRFQYFQKWRQLQGCVEEIRTWKEKGRIANNLIQVLMTWLKLQIATIFVKIIFGPDLINPMFVDKWNEYTAPIERTHVLNQCPSDSLKEEWVNNTLWATHGTLIVQSTSEPQNKKLKEILAPLLNLLPEHIQVNRAEMLSPRTWTVSWHLIERWEIHMSQKTSDTIYDDTCQIPGLISPHILDDISYTTLHRTFCSRACCHQTKQGMSMAANAAIVHPWQCIEVVELYIEGPDSEEITKRLNITQQEGLLAIEDQIPFAPPKSTGNISDIQSDLLPFFDPPTSPISVKSPSLKTLSRPLSSDLLRSPSKRTTEIWDNEKERYQLKCIINDRHPDLNFTDLRELEMEVLHKDVTGSHILTPFRKPKVRPHSPFSRRHCEKLMSRVIPVKKKIPPIAQELLRDVHSEVDNPIDLKAQQPRWQKGSLATTQMFMEKLRTERKKKKSFSLQPSSSKKNISTGASENPLSYAEKRALFLSELNNGETKSGTVTRDGSRASSKSSVLGGSASVSTSSIGVCNGGLLLGGEAVLFGLNGMTPHTSKIRTY